MLRIEIYNLDQGFCANFGRKYQNTFNQGENEVDSLKYRFDQVSRVKHPSVCCYYSMTSDEANLCLLTEGCFDSADRIFRELNCSFDTNTTLKMLGNITETLYFLHRKGISLSYLDLSNVSVSADEIKLTNWGIHALFPLDSIIKDPLFCSPEVNQSSTGSVLV